MKNTLGKILAIALISEMMSSFDEREIERDNSPKKVGDKVKLIDKFQLNYFKST